MEKANTHFDPKQTNKHTNRQQFLAFDRRRTYNVTKARVGVFFFHPGTESLRVQEEGTHGALGLGGVLRREAW
jgi:hypothetical protein